MSEKASPGSPGQAEGTPGHTTSTSIPGPTGTSTDTCPGDHMGHLDLPVCDVRVMEGKQTVHQLLKVRLGFVQ